MVLMAVLQGAPGLTQERPCVDTTRSVTVAAVGDVLLHAAVQRWLAGRADGLTPALAGVQPLISAADIAVANLEGPAALDVAPGGRSLAKPAATRFDGVAYNGYPMFNYHPALIGELAQAGFDVLQTANNHSLDRGSLGVDRTLEAIDAAGLRRTGTLHTQHRSGAWHTTVEVRKADRSYVLAFLSCSYGTNGMPDPVGQVLMCFEQRDEVLSTIRALHGRSDVHAVIVLPHWGQEYQSRPDAAQRALGQEMADAGASAIIGTHPHVVQPLSWLKAQDGRRVAVAWSLGNFISHQIGLERLSSFILGLALVPGDDGRLAAAEMGWVPIRTRTGGGYSVDLVQALDETTAKPVMTHLLRTLDAADLHPPKSPWWAHRACPR